MVACTQERALFSELATQAEKPLMAPLKFVNIRELAGWTQEADKSTPKIKALLALSDLSEPDAVPVVEYRSEGRVLVIANHSGQLPMDGVLIGYALATNPHGPRAPRAMNCRCRCA